MADNLKVFGTTYYDVQGQKFTDLDGNEKTYIRPAGTKQIVQNGTADVKKYEFAEVAVPASAVDEGTKQITQNGDGQDVIGYAAVDVNVPGIVPAGTKQINQNGTHDVAQYASAEVNVPNTYAASDEGKVVSNGELVAQTSQTIDENGTYDTTLKNEVVVDVQSGGPVLLASETATEDVNVMTISYDPATMSGYTYFEMEIEGVSIPGRQLFPCPQINTTSNKGYNGYVNANTAFHFYAPVVPYYSGNSHNIQGYRVSIGSANEQQAVVGNTISSFSYASYYPEGGFRSGTVFKVWGIPT